ATSPPWRASRASMRAPRTTRSNGSRSMRAGSTRWTGAISRRSPRITAAALGEERDVIEDVIEPYLVQQGYVQRTPRGRMLSDEGFRHLDLKVLRPAASQLDLLAEEE